MMETLLRIFAVFLLVLANGFFVTSEFAIVSVRRMQVASLAESGDRRARGLHASSEHASIYTEEEIRQLVNISHKSGHLEEEERQLINRVFDFSDAEVREAMIPRTEVQALPITATLEDCEEAFCDYGYSRLPVYRERLDDIAGVLFMKDLMPCLRTVGRVPFDMERMLHPALFGPATARLGSVLAQS